ncbi:unnamed protein product [Bathycoccus prasinos]
MKEINRKGLLLLVFTAVGSFGSVHAVTKLTDSTFKTAIASCLGESEQAAKDGLCTSYGAVSGYGTMPDLDVSGVLKMEGAFQDFAEFNADISNWNTGGVASMRNMFYGASAFNQDIGNWDTSRVDHMDGMFRDASAFNRDIGNWNTERASYYMGNMFRGASAFNQDISSWHPWGGRFAPPNIWRHHSNIFYGATAFQAKFECTNSFSGPVQSCRIKDTWIAPPPPPPPQPSPPPPSPPPSDWECSTVPGVGSYQTFNGHSVYVCNNAMLLTSYSLINEERKGKFLVHGIAPSLSGWSHIWLADLGLDSSYISEVRFFCNSSAHDRVTHFSVSNDWIKGSMVWGGGSMWGPMWGQWVGGRAGLVIT